MSAGGTSSSSGSSSSKMTTVIATPGGGPDRPQEITYTDTKVIGNGSFGIVYQARLVPNPNSNSASTSTAAATSSSTSSTPNASSMSATSQGASSSGSNTAVAAGTASSSTSSPASEMVAIKRVLQDKRFKNRELQIMRRLDHCNIVKLKYYFYTSGEKVRSSVFGI